MPSEKINRYVPNGVPLTSHETEILHCLQEECAEVIQDAAKLLRFGKENRPDTGIANTHKLSIEMGEVLCVMQLAIDAGLLSPVSIDQGKWTKRERLKHFMQTDTKEA
jgi:hypothetical protein